MENMFIKGRGKDMKNLTVREGRPRGSTNWTQEKITFGDYLLVNVINILN